MKRIFVTVGALLLLLLLAGCGGRPAQSGAVDGVEGDGAPPPPILTPFVEPSQLPAGAFAAKEELARVLGLKVDEVTVVGLAPALWPDGCLGLAWGGRMCATAVTPGYMIALEVDGQRYTYRTDESGGRVHLAEAPRLEMAEPAVVWSAPQGASLCRRAMIDGERIHFGACGGPQLAGHFVLPERQADLDYFVARYAPFEARSASGAVAFAGQGEKEATEAEQRMIAEWARLAVDEAFAGRSGASWGLALAWHMENDALCADLTVDLTGVAYATDCSTRAPETRGAVRLFPDELAALYDFVDELTPFDHSQSSAFATASVVLSGAGEKAPTDEDKMMVLEFGTYLNEMFSAHEPR